VINETAFQKKKKKTAGSRRGSGALVRILLWAGSSAKFLISIISEAIIDSPSALTELL
jgi:hypothetical protein